MLPVPVVPLPLLGGGTMLNPSDQHLDITVTLATPADAPFTDANHVAPRYVDSWDEFIGQEAVKAELRTFIDQALIECSVLPHVLLASTMPGIGKGHDVDTLLLTPKGWRRLGDLAVGDRVIGSDGRPTVITDIYERGTLPLYRVTFSDGSSVRCDAEHLWAVQTPDMRSKGRWTTRCTAELMSVPLRTAFGKARFYVPMTAPVQHEVTSLPVEPYLTGVMLGNADFGKGVISLNMQDRDVADRLIARQHAWWPNASIPAGWLAEYPTITALRFRPARANALLRLLGQHNIAAKDKFIPAAYLTAHIEARQELLAGLLDTDGSVRTNRGSALFHTTSLSLANGVQTLVESLGGTARVRPLRRGDVRVEINILENPFRSARKATLWKAPSRMPSRAIVSIEPDGEGEVRCIRVAAADSLYVTERYIVTHNTTLARVVADELGVRCVMIVPPFAPSTLYQAALTMQDGEILFIDEIHKLADNGPRASENLLHLMEEGVLYLDDGMHRLAEFCLMGATTDKGKLPETVVDRFMIKPWFDPYTDAELVRIAKNFCNKLNVVLLPETMVAIAQASRGTPRVVRELVISAKAMQVSRGRYVPPDELFAMKRIEPNGVGREHRAYILAMWRTGSQYVGERTMQSVLRENPQGLARIERVLMEQGLIIKTNRGRALTNAGVEAARRYLQEDR